MGWPASIQPWGDMRHHRETCHQCGDGAVRATSSWERLRRWFVYGGGRGHAYVCASCGAAWSSHDVLFSQRSAWRHCASMPAQVVAAVRRERTWEPVPRLYATVGAAAAAPAAVAAGLLVPARLAVVPHGEVAVLEHEHCRITVTATGIELSGLALETTRAVPSRETPADRRVGGGAR